MPSVLIRVKQGEYCNAVLPIPPPHNPFYNLGQNLHKMSLREIKNLAIVKVEYDKELDIYKSHEKDVASGAARARALFRNALFEECQVEDVGPFSRAYDMAAEMHGDDDFENIIASFRRFVSLLSQINDHPAYVTLVADNERQAARISELEAD